MKTNVSMSNGVHGDVVFHHRRASMDSESYSWLTTYTDSSALCDPITIVACSKTLDMWSLSGVLTIIRRQANVICEQATSALDSQDGGKILTTFPSKVPISMGIWTPTNTRFLGLTQVSPQIASQLVQPFLHSAAMCNTGRRTDHAMCNICSNKPYLLIACRQCSLIKNKITINRYYL